MPEAWGIVVVKTSVETTAALAACTNNVPAALVRQLLEDAGVDLSKLDATRFNMFNLGGYAATLELTIDHWLEGHIAVERGYVCLPIFGDQWNGVAHALTQLATTGECYARIGDEYGTTLRFSRNDQQKLFNCWNEEDADEDEDEDAVAAESAAWEHSIPAAVRSAFPDLVGSDDE
jgi:hypothetical protein